MRPSSCTSTDTTSAIAITANDKTRGVFGDAAAHFAAQNGLALESIERLRFEMWRPSKCPLCRAGVTVDRVADAG